MTSAFLAVVLVFLAIVSQTFGQECPKIYERYCPTHSYCLPPNSKCETEAFGLFPEQIDQVLALHNARRNEVASGSTKCPPASNMLKMEWDNELAAVAQKYASQCIYAHDKANCRRVYNFGVGQNIAMQKLTGGDVLLNPPQPDWDFAVNEWFAEIQYFSSEMMCPFGPPAEGSQEYRHFTQLAWGNTFRVGCGYVLYKEGGDTFTRLYVCNYGPAGNVYGECVYDVGNPCTGCPINSCCGKPDCFDYQGLCSRSNLEPPMYPPPQPNLFYCAFQKDSDCDNYINGISNWLIQPTLGGNYLGIDLNGGENSTIVFKKKIKPSQKSFCVIIKYRKGPSKYTDVESNTVEEVLYIPEQNYMVSQPLPSYENPERQQFATYNLTLSWDQETQLKISFAVPKDAPSQFLNIQSILAVDGACEDKH